MLTSQPSLGGLINETRLAHDAKLVVQHPPEASNVNLTNPATQIRSQSSVSLGNTDEILSQSLDNRLHQNIHHLHRVHFRLKSAPESSPNTGLTNQTSSDSRSGVILQTYMDETLNWLVDNWLGVALIGVIIIYLVFYFSKISKKPKLIGSDNGKFSKFIKATLGETISHRFSPLIYFWGTNPQTALFGYLEGQNSADEVPRSDFRRQYLYVSDAQYLTTNVDLSQYYVRPNEKSTSSSLEAAATSSSNNLGPKKRPLELQLDEPSSLEFKQQQQQPANFMNQNIQAALKELLSKSQVDQKETIKQEVQIEMPRQLLLTEAATSTPPITKRNHTSNNEIGRQQRQDITFIRSTSSDSGVSAGQSTASSSSASSLADLSFDHEKACKCEGDTTGSVESSGNTCSPSLTSSANGICNSGTNVLRERYEFGQCALDWHLPSHSNYHKNRLVALISAGMTSGSDKKYVTDTVLTLDRLGYEVCVFIRRGVGGLKLSSDKFFSPAKWRDFERAVQSVREQRPNANLVAVGFSFGSIELCRYLAMSGPGSLVNAALLISCPFDPEAGGRNMRKRALNRKIDAYLAKNLGKQLYNAMVHRGDSNADKSDLSQWRNYNGSCVDLNALPKIKSLVEFEEKYNRVMQNYPDIKAYADDSRLHEHLAAITTPTLCISSEDDFMAPLELLPLEQIKANENICMILTKRGGHMAFIDGLIWPKKPYFAQRIIALYMEAVKSSILVVKPTESGPKNSAPSTLSCYELNKETQHRADQKQPTEIRVSIRVSQDTRI